MAWATIEQVELLLGVDSDDRMTSALAVSLDWCHRARPDLDPDADPGAAVSHAVALYATLLYRERGQGSTAGYDELGAFQDGTTFARVNDLLGRRKPVAR